MSKWMDEAGALQRAVAYTEKNGSNDYEAEAVRTAVIHSREDIVLLVSLLDSANEQIADIRKTLTFLAVMVAIALAPRFWASVVPLLNVVAPLWEHVLAFLHHAAVNI